MQWAQVIEDNVYESSVDPKVILGKPQRFLIEDENVVVGFEWP